ncbi:PRC-barrel domain-containing protein [uncultured Methanobrevibacter sp.]|uniref:PRC-barrel domain-containing protein n=1 Tax=uncultured Methanobrevibacter sp. TaxID=253161 RepID=UPI0025D45858|nr:PRC-barrel domain-containing protein [uncultured Methanobrevibacter sp.]
MKIVADIIGKEVLDVNAIHMGVVSDLEFDEDTKELLSIILKQKGFSAFNSSNSEEVVPFDLIKTIGEKIILKGEFDI